jgi:superfamily II DNA helicase RecQ
MALTATATIKVFTDVVTCLGIDGCLVLKQSFNRPNLSYSVVPKRNKKVVQDIAEWILANHPQATGIIYCFSQRNCEDVAKELRDSHNLRARHYHAGLADEDRKRTQDAWKDGKIKIIVATVREITGHTPLADGSPHRSRLEWGLIRQTVCQSVPCIQILTLS